MEENETLVKRIQQGYDVNKNMTQLYDQNKKLIFKTVSKYADCDHITDMDDLQQDGYIIFHDAVYGYEESKGKFSTYLCNCIGWKMNRAMQNKKIIRFPEYLALDMRRYIEFRNSYIEIHIKEPTEEEYIKHLKITKSRLNGIQQAIKVSDIKELDKPIDETGSTMISMIGSNRNDIQGIENKYDLGILWNQITEILSKKELRIIYLVYIKGVSQKECAKIFDCTRQYINLVIQRSLKKIRKKCKWLADG